MNSPLTENTTIEGSIEIVKTDRKGNEVARKTLHNQSFPRNALDFYSAQCKSLVYTYERESEDSIVLPGGMYQGYVNGLCLFTSTTPTLANVTGAFPVTTIQGTSAMSNTKARIASDGDKTGFTISGAWAFSTTANDMNIDALSWCAQPLQSESLTGTIPNRFIQALYPGTDNPRYVTGSSFAHTNVGSARAGASTLCTFPVKGYDKTSPTFQLPSNPAAVFVPVDDSDWYWRSTGLPTSDPTFLYASRETVIAGESPMVTSCPALAGVLSPTTSMTVPGVSYDSKLYFVKDNRSAANQASSAGAQVSLYEYDTGNDTLTILRTLTGCRVESQPYLHVIQVNPTTVVFLSAHSKNPVIFLDLDSGKSALAPCFYYYVQSASYSPLLLNYHEGSNSIRRYLVDSSNVNGSDGPTDLFLPISTIVLPERIVKAADEALSFNYKVTVM
jgi:hypothetical protein